MPKPEAPKYRTSNWNAYNAALKSGGALLISIDKDRAWFAAKGGKRGRAQTFTAIQFCLSILCLFRRPLRQSIGMVEGLLRQVGLDWLGSRLQYRVPPTKNADRCYALSSQ